MPAPEHTSDVERDLTSAIDELQSALALAGEATSRIRTLLPRIGAVSAMLEEIESVLQSGRRAGAMAPAAFARPTLLVANDDAAALASPDPTSTTANPTVADSAIEDEPQQQTADLICFRLEFQSNGSPLDLRAVDEAVGEHPAVRDVALLDYDGRNATLKVWIVSTASPAEIEDSLNRRASDIFPDGSNITIVALEDAA